jgi:hypothetical protein
VAFLEIKKLEQYLKNQLEQNKFTPAVQPYTIYLHVSINTQPYFIKQQFDIESVTGCRNRASRDRKRNQIRIVDHIIAQVNLAV